MNFAISFWMSGPTTGATGTAITKATAKPRNHLPTKLPPSPVFTAVIAKDMHSETSTLVTIHAIFLLSFNSIISFATTMAIDDTAVRLVRARATTGACSYSNWSTALLMRTNTCLHVLP